MPDLSHPVDFEVVLPDTLDLRKQNRISLGTI